MTKENVEIEDEHITGFIREEQEPKNADVDPSGESSVEEAVPTDVLEGEVVEEEAEVDELTALQQQLEAAQAAADEYLDDLRRERAAFQNYKKRQENERAELRAMALAGLLVQILPILDDLERALDTLPDDQSDQPWVAGVKLIQRKLHTTLESNSVTPIKVEPGQPFDPFIHEAVSHEEHDDHEGGEIIGVVQNGYKLGERTLRPAMVRVAK